MPSTTTVENESWFKKHKFGLLLGVAAVSTVALFTLHPASETINKLEKDTPVAVGMVALEAAWIGGAALMLGSVGRATKNSLQIKSQLNHIASSANNSRVFKAGFWINTTAAVGEFIVPAVAITTRLPPESWGILAPFVADFVVTVALRKSIRSGIKKNATQIID